MPVRHSTQPLVRDLFTAEARAARGGRPAAGMFLSSGDCTAAEICAGSGLDYLLIDGEHAPLSLETVLAQLRTIAGYGVPVMTRVPALDAVLVKQYLDLGAQTLLVPMVDDADQASRAVEAVRYPPHGVRGVGSALARSGRWNRVPGYLDDDADHVSLFVQIETRAGVENARAIAETDGVDGIFVGPSDLSASMGLLGQQSHPDVVAAVESVIRAANEAGTVVGVNAFVQAQARAYAEAGADFVNVGADVALLARAAEALADEWCPAPEGGAEGGRASY
ncbi:HpcH/HpaI aldolase/citrate lyase family protein [Micrococcus sp.]|uniref:HpcH/HpaI aldolase family protein n=1 Tax=Micrococcus sp. TaxID=1271 RepID=UPI0026DAD853|nr:HpcH/HpaI aldolase/citrate lyase family protein [Micrococcus sp.]MDO4238767.1 HpcH/HpaI aldolase/citrate lyase family protein [Micrococcus sp.]